MMKELAGQRIIFLFLGILCQVVAQLPYLKIPYYEVPIPLTIDVIFFFAIFNPTFYNAFFAFILGIMTDIMAQEPFVLAFLYPALFWGVSLNQKLLLRLTFIRLWGVFAVIAGLYFFILDICFQGISGVPLPSGAVILQYLFVLLSYPAVAGGCSWILQKIGGIR